MPTKHLKTSITTSNTTSDSQAVEVGSSTTFPRFPDLPMELRLKIWEEALPDARVVELDWRFQARSWSFSNETQKAIGLTRASKESREVFLKVCAPYVHSTGCAGSGYMNIFKDTLFIAPFSPFRTLRHNFIDGWNEFIELSHQLKELRSLAVLALVRSGSVIVPWSHSLEVGNSSQELDKLLRLSPRLSELIIVIPPRHGTKTTEIYYEPPLREFRFVDVPVDQAPDPYESEGKSKLREVNNKNLRRLDGSSTRILIKRAIRKHRKPGRPATRRVQRID